MSHHHVFCLFHVILILLKVGIGLAIAYFVVNYIRKELRKKKQLDRNSVIVISGGSRAIGGELAQLFATLHHCKVVLLDTEDKETMEGLLSNIQNNQSSCARYYQIDYKDKNTILIALAQIVAEFQKIDVFIHTGGFTLEKTFEDYCYEELSEVMESNFLGPTILVKELLTIMKKQTEGHIVSVPSNLEVFNSEDIFTYCGAKGALGKLFQGLQAELKRKNSNVKISIARPLLMIDKAIDELDMGKVRNYANKIYNGIIYEMEDIN